MEPELGSLEPICDQMSKQLIKRVNLAMQPKTASQKTAVSTVGLRTLHEFMKPAEAAKEKNDE